MFNYAHEDPDPKPLVLCQQWSRLLIFRWIPIQLLTDSKFHINEYSWNRARIMIYSESLGDVSFSYIDSKLDYELYINSYISAQDNLQALLSFFNKFPSMKEEIFTFFMNLMQELYLS